MKSILVHVSDDETMDTRLQTALDIARATSGHLTCLHVTPVSNYAMFDGFGGVYAMGALIDEANESIVKTEARLEARMQLEDVSWNYRHADAEFAPGIVRQSGLQDLIVVSRPPSKAPSFDPVRLFGAILAGADAPILVVPANGGGLDITAPILVAWNGSLEAAKALRLSLPLLKLASAVHIICVEEDKTFDFPPLEASEYLSRHGIASEIHQKSGAKSAIDAILVSSAQDLSASMIVMGAYGHSRTFEYVFGGVTKALLNACPMHLLLAR